MKNKFKKALAKFRQKLAYDDRYALPFVSAILLIFAIILVYTYDK